MTERRTKRRYAHELYPHPEEGEARPLEAEVVIVDARTPDPSESEREAMAEQMYQATRSAEKAADSQGRNPTTWDAMLACADVALARRHPTPAPALVETVEDLFCLPSRTAVRDRNGDVGVWQTNYLHYPETAVIRAEYAIKHYGPFTVLTPATSATVSAEAFVEGVKYVFLSTPYDLPTSKALVSDIFREARLPVAEDGA